MTRYRDPAAGTVQNRSARTGGNPDGNARPATRVSLRPHEARSGKEIEREDVVEGYEYGRGQLMTFTPGGVAVARY